MLNVYDLSRYQLYRLKSIDPNLTYNWQTDVSEIFHLLDADSRHSVTEKIFKPRGILYDKVTQKFFHDKPTSLAEVCENEIISNPKLWQSAKYLLSLLSNDNEPVNIATLADDIEASLHHLNTIEINENTDEHLIRRKIRNAFLYDFAYWIDDKTLIFDAGVRRLTEDMVKSYIKEVYIKQQLQGWDFRSWEGEDIDFLGVEHFPEDLKQYAKGRKLQIVENSKYWFLIGPVDKVGQNAFSLRRFLYEDKGRLSVFLTHVIVPRALFDKEHIRKFLLNCIERIYTLERSIGPEVLNFIESAKKHNTME